MAENYKVGLTLPNRDYKFIDKAIRREHGSGIEEIAESDPLSAFDALGLGLTALLTRRGYKTHVSQVASKGEEPKTQGVVDRELDGEQAFNGSISNSISGTVVGAMVQRYFEADQDFTICTVSEPGFIGKQLGRKPVQQIVAIIPRNN